MKKNCRSSSKLLTPNHMEKTAAASFEDLECNLIIQWDWFCDWDFEGEWIHGKKFPPCVDLDDLDTVSSIITNCDGSERKGVKRNAVGDIGPTTRPSKNLPVDQLMLKMVSRHEMSKQLKKIQTESFNLETGDSEFSGVQLKKTMENANIASIYPKRPKTHDPTTLLSCSNLELEHKVQTLRNKATQLRGLLKFMEIPDNGFLAMDYWLKVMLLEMDDSLRVICETFSLPLAQYWGATDPYVGPLRMQLNIGEGLVGKTYLSHKSLFCRDIIELRKNNQPLAHYSLNCGSIACFTICLRSIFPKYRECVVEFFLPSQEMDSFYPQTLLNSLLATMKERPPYFMLASGEQLGELLSVDVINTSTMHNRPESFKIGQHKSSLSDHEDSKKEGDILFIEKSNVAINSDEATTSGETSKRTPVNVALITDLDELEEESLMKCTESKSLTSQLKRTKKIVEGERSTVRIDHSTSEMNLEKGMNHREGSVADELGDELEEVSPSMSIEPQSLASQPKRSEEILGDEGNTVKIDHSAMEMTSEEAILHKEHTMAEKRVVIGVEGSTVEDIGYTRSTASQPSSFQTMISLPQQEVEEDPSTQKLMLEDVVRTQIVVLEKDNTTINFASKTCIQETSEREKQSKNSNSYQKICEQFGRRLDDAGNGYSGDELEKESPIKCIKPKNLTSQPNRSGKISEEIGSTAEIDHSSKEITFEEATNHKEQTEAAQAVYYLEEDSYIQYTEPRSLTPRSKRTEIILKDDGNIMEKDHFAPEMILKESIQHRVHSVADQGVEPHISKQENMLEKDISYENLSQYFGRLLDDARKSFGVSRTAFKKMCRDVGITRWKYGKRNMGENSSKPRRRLNDEEGGRRNFSSGMIPVQDTPAVSDTSLDLKKMTVKATYNGVPIRFNLPDLSRLSELQDNVIKRLHLERNSFSIKYHDDEGEWVLIACDEDVRECVEFSRSLQKTTIKMLIDLPVDH
ncbi:hypothetical protein POM88_002649 [Heracleum sosnowskyi]|uniref:PB1 domain-containing protein n=1 Tax=Heracleum sosnowskyi TaxID=360622 RepID=A0AAD8JF43_9APIA|nr:hypothetical protein POM88_002649 [Heracleum sosnowskyi]